MMALALLSSISLRGCTWAVALAGSVAVWRFLLGLL